METLYYTIHNWVEEYGEGATISLYQIRNNKPVIVSEIERDLDAGFSELDELNFHVEDWEEDITYNFVKL